MDHALQLLQVKPLSKLFWLMQCTGFFGKREDRSERHSVKPHAIELHGSPSEFITEFIRNLNVTFSIVNMCPLKWPSRSQHGCILAVLVYSELSCVDIWCAGVCSQWIHCFGLRGAMLSPPVWLMSVMRGFG